MTEQQQMEYAAKAANIKGWWSSSYKAIQVDTAPLRNFVMWSPRTENGDAFRLMVTLGLDIQRDKWDGQVYAGNLDVLVKLPLGKDHAAATREAIFQAAVAIGKAMP